MPAKTTPKTTAELKARITAGEAREVEILAEIALAAVHDGDTAALDAELAEIEADRRRCRLGLDQLHRDEEARAADEHEDAKSRDRLAALEACLDRLRPQRAHAAAAAHMEETAAALLAVPYSQRLKRAQRLPSDSQASDLHTALMIRMPDLPKPPPRGMPLASIDFAPSHYTVAHFDELIALAESLIADEHAGRGYDRSGEPGDGFPRPRAW